MSRWSFTGQLPKLRIGFVTFIRGHTPRANNWTTKGSCFFYSPVRVKTAKYSYGSFSAFIACMFESSLMRAKFLVQIIISSWILLWQIISRGIYWYDLSMPELGLHCIIFYVYSNPTYIGVYIKNSSS